jgi:hypothetical protein
LLDDGGQLAFAVELRLRRHGNHRGKLAFPVELRFRDAGHLLQRDDQLQRGLHLAAPLGEIALVPREKHDLELAEQLFSCGIFFAGESFLDEALDGLVEIFGVGCVLERMPHLLEQLGAYGHFMPRI